MKIAVIKTGSKQYLVSEGNTVKVEKLTAPEGASINIGEVLLAATDKATKVGTPYVEGAQVKATVLRHGKREKIMGVKMKPKKRYRRLFGHRQHFTELEIKKVTV